MKRPHKPSSETERGFSMPIIAIILGLVFALVYVMMETVLMTNRAGTSLKGNLTAQQVAEAGLHKAIYCMNTSTGENCSGNYGATFSGETDVSYANGFFSTTVSGSGNIRIIESTGRDVTGKSVKLRVDATSVPPTDDTSFTYALQAGAGGAYLENNSSVSGSIYANGNITCQGINAEIAGDAYVAKASGVIDSCGIGYDAHADSILDSEIGRDAYYYSDPSGISGSTVGRDSYSYSVTPEPQALPTLDKQFWRDFSAAGGTYIGNYHPADNSHIGPLKIVGDLILDQNVDVIVDGPIWIKGNLYTGNNSSFTLNPSFGAYGTTILADDQNDPTTKGKMDITNNTSIYGSGQPTSHIMFVATSTSNTDASPALSVANNAAGAVFYATDGTLRLQNNAGAKSLAAYRLSISQNAVVNYIESEMTGNFSNSPGGVWRIIDGTWHEVE